MPLLVQQTGFTGFYFRVLQEGWIGVNSQIQLVKQDPLNVTLSFANQIMVNDKNDIEGLQKLLTVEALSESWKAALRKRLE